MERAFLEQLRQEIAAWQRERLISDGQAHTLLARSGLVEGELEVRRSRFAYALAFLGALLIGIGAILFFAANWPFIPGWVKLLLIFSAVILAYVAGYWMRFERQWAPRAGSALIFLGALLFGAAIFLVAQGFHVRADEPTLVYLWVIGILPLAYLLAAPALVTVAIVAAGIGLGWELDGLDLPLPAVLGAYLALGVLLYGLGELHRQSERRAELQSPYIVLGLVLILGAIYAASFPESWTESWPIGMGARPTPSSPFGWRFGALCLAALLAGARLLWVAARRASARPMVWEPLVAVVLLGMAWIMAFAGHLLVSRGVVFYPPAAIVINLLLFALTIGVIAAGSLEHRPTLVNIGVLCFGVHLFTRYFDIFGRLLHTSVAFIGAGMLLLIGGMALERTRRLLVRDMGMSVATEGGN